jgi:hypothetical protein
VRLSHKSLAIGLATLAVFAGLSSCHGPAEDVRRGAAPEPAADAKVLNGGARGEVCKSVAAKLGFGAVVPGAGVGGSEVIAGWDAAEMSFAEAPENGVFVDKSEKAVCFFEDGELTHIWPCATGKPETPTPAGRFEVTATLEKPTWFWRGKVIPPGPDNGLGDWFIGINKKRYGIHGTNEPASIRKAVSHGCVRMYNDDAGELVKLVSRGTPVVIVE